ncbi:MAG: FAD-binding protein [Gemmatimonas sp.]
MHESSQSLAEHLRSTIDPIRIVANGSWLNAGRPTAEASPLSVQGVRGIVEYVPGDLTITVRAGTPHSEIDAATFHEGQWLGLDPAGAHLGTVGATIATAAAGPLVHGIGAVRDIVLGLEVVSGNGVITRSGGKVVKNVAGFDLVRLQTGAWGTLGIITEVSLRLRARPETDETVAIELDGRTPLLAHLIRLKGLTLSPLSIELIGAPLATTLGISSQQLFLIRLGGNETRVKAQRAQLATLGALNDCNTTIWESLQRLDHDNAVSHSDCAVARVSHLPSQLPLAWSHVHSELSSVSLAPVLSRATISRGTVRLVVPHSPSLSRDEYRAAVSSVTRTLAPPGGHVVWERLPKDAWTNVPSAVADRLSRGLQRTFDPDSRCNSGILGATFVG